MSKNKLFFVFIIIFLFLIFANILVKAQETVLPPELEGVEKLQNITEKLTDEEKREYLFQEWQKILRENKVVATVDSFFTKYSMFFRIVFGMPYSLSLTLAFVIILWLFIAVAIADLTRKGLGFLEGLSYILGIVAAVVLAQLQILRRFSAFLVKLIFYPESAWARFIIFMIIVAILILLYYLKGGLSQAIEASRKKRAEEETEQKQKEIKKFTEGLEKGAGI